MQSIKVPYKCNISLIIEFSLCIGLVGYIFPSPQHRRVQKTQIPNQLYKNLDGMFTLISDFIVFFIGGMQNELIEKILEILLIQEEKNLSTLS